MNDSRTSGSNCAETVPSTFALRSDLTKLRDKYRDNVTMKHLISLSIKQLEHLEKLPDGEQKTRLTGLLEDNMRRLHKALSAHRGEE